MKATHLPFLDLVNAVTTALDASGIAHAITGSVACAIHGKPHSSDAIEVCVHMSDAQALRLATELPERFFRSADAIQQVACDSGTASLADITTGMRVDLSCEGAGAYLDALLSRRERVHFVDGAPEHWVVSPEDAILATLRMYRATGSSLHWEDCLAVARCQGAGLDWRYTREWAAAIGCGSEFEKVLQEARV